MRLDDRCGVYWPVTPNMPARFEDLFENDCAVDAVPAGAREHVSWRLVILPEDEALVPEGFSTVNAATHPFARGIGKLWWNLRGRPTDRYRYMLFPKQHSRRTTRRDARHIDLEYERIPESLREVYRRYFSRIAVRSEIVSRVDEWASRELDDDVIGIQIRSWRDDARRHRKYHRPSVARLLGLINAAGHERRFLVVTDSDELISWLASELGRSRVLQYPRSTLRSASYQETEGMVEDLIDMLLLARTKEFFASYLSTFGETAWWLGGAKAHVKVF